MNALDADGLDGLAEHTDVDPPDRLAPPFLDDEPLTPLILKLPDDGTGCAPDTLDPAWRKRRLRARRMRRLGWWLRNAATGALLAAVGFIVVVTLDLVFAGDPRTIPEGGPAKPAVAAPVKIKTHVKVDSAVAVVGTPSGTVPARETAEYRFPARFERADVGLHELDQTALQAMVRDLLQSCRGPITLTGHSCSLGETNANLKMSQRRAEEARRALLRAGVAATRLVTAGAGSAQPIADNRTSEGRNANRRVTVSCSRGQASPGGGKP